MEVLIWLLIPIAVTVLGLLYLVWRNRDRKPADAQEGMEGMARFREAMAKPLPPLQRERRPEGEQDPQADGAGRSA